MSEIERLYHGALLSLLSGERTAGVESLEEVAHKIPGQTVVELLLARELALQGRHAEAIGHFRAIRGTLSQSSQALAGLALSLHEAGKDDEALALLRRVHARGRHDQGLRQVVPGSPRCRRRDARESVLTRLKRRGPPRSVATTAPPP